MLKYCELNWNKVQVQVTVSCENPDNLDLQWTFKILPVLNMIVLSLVIWWTLKFLEFYLFWLCVCCKPKILPIKFSLTSPFPLLHTCACVCLRSKFYNRFLKFLIVQTTSFFLFFEGFPYSARTHHWTARPGRVMVIAVVPLSSGEETKKDLHLTILP